MLQYGRVPRRDDVVTYRVCAELKETSPPLWRRIEVRSDLNLAEVHDILQVVFGWTDSHLHGFAAGPEFYSDRAERYLCPFDEYEGDAEGVPEAQVRLDEVLAETGDTLTYAYDYGDGWEHLLTLETIRPREDGARRAVCTGGERDGPAEDCGGPHSYDLISAATGPASPGRTAAALEFAEIYGQEVDPHDLAGTPFDLDAVNARLQLLGDYPAVDVASLPDRLAELVHATRSTVGLRTLHQLIAAADLTNRVRADEIAPATAERMVRAYSWLLERVGQDGIKLTKAGYLPPAHVAAAFTELGLADEWVGEGNREADTVPVLNLRESAQRLGLLRKHQGALLLTAAGRRLRSDPVALWWHLAGRMPLRSADPFESQAALLFLLGIAGGVAGDLDATVAGILDSIGWRLYDGTSPTASAARRGAYATVNVLRRLGTVTDRRHAPGSEVATPEGVLFARAALQSLS